MKYLVLLTFMITDLTHTDAQCIPNPGVTPGPNDPPFPQLPNTFVTRIEATIKNKQKTLTVEEYIDYDNNKAVLKTTTGGQYTTKLFDYKNNQILDIDENNICTVKKLSQNQDTQMLGGTTTVDGVEHIFSSDGVLRFMQKSGQAYKGPTYVRGINTDHWSTCMVWPFLNATFTLDYFFTTQNWNTAISFPQIPVRAIVAGTQTLANGTKYQFEHYYEYVDFRVDINDYTVFEIPKGAYCPGMISSRPLPTIPSSLHYRAEITSKESKEIGFYDIWYDKDLNLVRHDFKPDKNNPQSEVYDFTTGVMYATDVVTGACTITPIPSYSSFTTIGTNGEKLINQNSFFLLDANYAYSGQRLARGIKCDVFTSQRLYPYQGAWYNSTVDFYFLSTYYKELPADGTTAPTDIPFRLEATLKVPGMDDLFIMYNFLDFDTAKRSISDFDISACYKNMRSLRFQLRLPGPFRQQDTDLLKLQAQKVLPGIMNVTQIRLQQMQVDFDPSTVYLTTTLLDVAPDYAKFENVTSKQYVQGTTLSTNNMDRSVDFIGTWKDCATECIQNYGFICNSFDFCPNKTTSCFLYKDRRTNIQNYLNTHNPPCLSYSIYQRTVSGISNQETAVDVAFGYLRAAINQKAVHLQTFDPNKTVTDYYAVETEIIRGVLIPQGIMPSLSGQFSFRDEITVPYLKRVLERDVWYDYNFKLARYDLVTTGAPFFTDNPLVHIHDYNSGVAYVIDTGRQNCTIKQISKNLFGHQQDGYYSMNNPLDLFDMNRTYTFVGQKSVRGMTCHVFEAKVNNFKLFMTDPDVYTSTFQYYFLKDDWTENSDSGFGPTRAQPIRLDISSAQKGLYLTFNYYNWNNRDPDLSNFNIVPCYTGDQQKHFVIVFTGQYYPYLDSNVKFFKLEVHNKLSQMTNASVIRFQQPQIDYGLTNVYVIMTVVDPAPQFDGVPYLPEPDTDSIIDTLNDNIYRGLLNISVAQPDGSIYTFNATAITDNILRNDGRPLSSKTMSHFKVIKNKSQKSITGVLSGISVDECGDACLSELEFDCYSFVYCPNTGMCFMAKTYAQQRPDLTYDRPNCDLYYRSYIDKFTKMPGQTSPVKSSQTSAAATSESCAQQCIDDPTAACRSFVFCEISQTCSLLQTHNLDISKTTNNTNFDKCFFYSRSYLNDFKKKSRSTMQFTQVLDIEAVSVDQCAKLCIQTESITCNSFAFCGNSTTCRLTPSHPKSGMRTIATDYCDLYSRTYYTPKPIILTTTTATSSVKQSKPVTIPQTPPSSQSPSTMTTGTQTNSATKLKQSSTSNGYSAGAMAGVAIGLLIIGIICGGGLVILFFKRKRENPMEYFNMNYTGENKEK